MKLLTGVVLLCLAASCRAIVGGSNAAINSYPYHISIRTSSYLCGGSIINNRSILTAAHCVSTVLGIPASVNVVAGTTLRNGGMGQSYQSDKIIPHPNYNALTRQNDIAIIRVSKDIQFNDKVKPIGLTSKNPYEDGYPVTLTGWGSTRVGGPLANNLQQINLKILDQEKCKKAYKNVLNIGNIMDSQICTLTKRGEGPCTGDSGSPLVADGVQVGVFSYGSCAQGQPDVFVRVYSYLDWIAAETA